MKVGASLDPITNTHAHLRHIDLHSKNKFSMVSIWVWHRRHKPSFKPQMWVLLLWKNPWHNTYQMTTQSQWKVKLPHTFFHICTHCSPIRFVLRHLLSWLKSDCGVDIIRFHCSCFSLHPSYYFWPILKKINHSWYPNLFLIYFVMDNRKIVFWIVFGIQSECVVDIPMKHLLRERKFPLCFISGYANLCFSPLASDLWTERIDHKDT